MIGAQKWISTSSTFIDHVVGENVLEVPESVAQQSEFAEAEQG